MPKRDPLFGSYLYHERMTGFPALWPWPFLRVAHRGAPTRAPGNSVRGFALAAALGADMVETDVRLSADGALVLSHDDTAPLPGLGRRPVSIARSPLAALRAPVAGGEPLATLDEALAQRRHGAPLAFNLDLKVVGVGPRSRAPCGPPPAGATASC